MDKINHHRRKWLAIGGAALGLSLIPGIVTAASTKSTSKTASSNKTTNKSQTKTRTLLIKNINTNETIQSTYFNGKSYNKAELARLDHLFRDRRTNQVKAIDPKLFDKLYQLQKQFGNRQIEVICGYRTTGSNSAMHSKNKNVAKNSYHTLGKAVDIRIVGVPLKSLRDAALKLKSGGVGYYPSNNFVHVDTGPERSWSS
ncbi:MAG: YcbK family protein [Enterobacteriaceae bacterium]|jgi:uncharacterized protein YcbK (DUF882 family)|nr:YcbK family protein [Enterobacteriaceae bacterium]